MAIRSFQLLSLCLAGFPGTCRALEHLADATGSIRHLVVPAAEPDSFEVRFYADLIRRTRPRLVVLGGWSAAYEPLVAAARVARSRTAVYWTSSASQVDLAGECGPLCRVLADDRIAERWFVDRGLADVLNGPFPGVRWVPNVFAPTRLARLGPRPAREAEPQVSLFCAPHGHGRKNVLATLLAVAALGRPCVLHVTGLSGPSEYGPVLEALGIRRVEHGWLERREFDRVVADMDLGLQVSLAESNNYVAIEHLLSGVPVVVSAMVPAVSDLPEAAARWFVVSRPDRVASIAERMDAILSERDTTRRMVGHARRALARKNRAAVSRARDVLHDAARRRA